MSERFFLNVKEFSGQGLEGDVGGIGKAEASNAARLNQSRFSFALS